jgi:arabinogalactan endo-1,4-beta-galactosidase
MYTLVFLHVHVVSDLYSKISRPTGSTSNWSNIARILHSAAWGVKDAATATSTTAPLIIVHTDNGWNQATQTWFYSNLMAQGTFLSTDFDIMGFSFYPFYGTSATLANLKSSLEYMISTYGKDVIIAETDFPNSCSGVTLSESSIPVSAAGQTEWVSDIISLLEALPNSHGKGMSAASVLLK